MPRRKKGFALSLGDSSSEMAANSTSGSGSSQSVTPTQVTQGQGSGQEAAYRKRVLSKEYFWFDGPLSRAISNTIKSFYNGQCTCLSNLPPEELQLWWRTFEGQYTWDSELTAEVKELWLKVVGENLRNLVNKAGKRPDNKPLVWLSEQGQERLKAQRSDPKFQKKSAQCLKNRTQGPNAATLHCQGSISTAELARRMIKEGKTPTPSALFARSHSKEDPEAGTVFIDDRSKALWEKYEALRTERGIEEGTQEAEKLYYEVSGG